MNKVILIGLCMLLVGCKTFDIDENITIGSSWNISSPPVKQFCKDMGGEYTSNNLFVYVISWGCIDKNGEIHSYEITSNNNTWIIGNRSYPIEWSG